LIEEGEETKKKVSIRFIQGFLLRDGLLAGHVESSQGSKKEKGQKNIQQQVFAGSHPPNYRLPVYVITCTPKSTSLKNLLLIKNHNLEKHKNKSRRKLEFFRLGWYFLDIF